MFEKTFDLTAQSGSVAEHSFMDSKSDFRWFVARVKPQHEAGVVQGLDCREIESFFPTYELQRENKQASRRILRTPLFPGYVFCRFMQTQRSKVLKTPGVASIISFGGIPEPVSDEEIGRVRIMVDSGVPVQPWPYLERGQTVSIERGPLRGVEGIVVDAIDGCHLVVSVTLLQRSVSVRMENDMVSLVSIPVRGFLTAQRN